MEDDNMNIRAKLIISFLVVTILTAIPTVVSLNRLRSTDDNYGEILHNYGFLQGDIGRAMLELTISNTLVHDIGAFEDEADLNNAIKERDEALKLYDEYIGIVKNTLVNDEDMAQFDKAIAATDKFFETSEEIIDFSANNDSSISTNYEEIERMLINDLKPKYDAAYAEWDILLANMVTDGDKVSDEITKTNDNTYTLLVVISCIMVIISFVTGVIESIKISDPLKKCVERIDLLAEGDLKTKVPEVNTKDETGDLANALKTLVYNLGQIIADERNLLGKMSEGDFTVRSTCESSYVGDFTEIINSIRTIRGNLSEILTDVNVAAEQVSVGSEQVASGAQELAQGATEQASAIEQLNAAIDNIANEIKETAENAKKASEFATNSELEVEEGNKQMNEMVIAMTEITETSNKIAKIIKTIDDIAFQTNILALNAAVEAARAGVAGKGFSVVADEVRNLAGKSAEAAKNTTELIESSINAVANGTKIADKTAEVLIKVVEATRKSTDLINEIAKSSEEQAKSIEETTKGLEQISSVVQTNSATSEQSAAASEELSCQAHRMKEIIGGFKLDKSAHRRSKSYSSNKSSSSKKSSSKSDSYDDIPDIDLIDDIDLGDEFTMDYGSKY